MIADEMNVAPTVTWTITRGSVMRLAMLMTHYRQPVDWTEARLADAGRVLERWVRVAIPCDDPPPVAVIEALCDDLNTPQAIAAMHKLRKAGDGRGLFAAMRFLGLLPESPSCTVDEWKTIPCEHAIEMDMRPMARAG
jgi:hypothetical protein